MNKVFLLLLFILTPLWGTWVSQNAKVRQIIDGDTIKVSFSPNAITTVRLLYIDTFETSRNKKMSSDVKKLQTLGYNVSEKLLLNKGIEAKRWLINRIPPGTFVKLEWNDTSPSDHYGRLLALVYTISPESCINEELILAGLAKPYFVGKTPPQHQKRMEKAYQNAIQMGKWQWLESKRKK